LPLLISLSAVQDLSSEELEPLKDALLAHLRSQNAAIRDQVDRNLHVTRGERVPAYAFTLQSLIETRDSVPSKTVKPYSAEAEKDLPPSGEPPPDPQKTDIWTFPSEEREDFSSHVGTYFIPGTTRVDDCRECFQKGELGCKACLGKGMESCSACLGAGRQSCVFCKGSEKVSCLRCGGEGRLASGEVGGRSASCDACGSTGKFPCTHCAGGKVSCAQCRGGGQAPCQKCKGQGKILCASCGGQKKIISGHAFQAAFRSFQVRSATLTEPGPKDALGMALEKTMGGGVLPLSPGEPFHLQVKEADLPTAVRQALNEIVEREKAQESSSSRVVKRRLEFAEGSAVRITGYCSGQEFAFWILPGTNRIVSEKDPMAAFGSSAATSAEEAREAGDWKKALALARESLSYSPTQSGARHIVGAWRRKVVMEAAWVGCAGGVIAAAGHAVWIGGYVKGLHKAGAILHAAGLALILGPLTALLLLPLLLRATHSLLRKGLLVGGLAGIFILNAASSRWSANTTMNPIRAADQMALDKELKEHFKYGVPQAYYEPDLRFLQALIGKYKNSQADLRRVNEAVVVQIDLRAQLARHQAEFEVKIREIVYSNAPAGRKRASLTKLAQQYRLMGVDLTPVEKASETVPADRKGGTSQRVTPPSRMSIKTSAPPKSGRAVPKKKSPPPKPSPPAKKPDPKRPTVKSGDQLRWWE
jgi:hypothetical protein